MTMLARQIAPGGFEFEPTTNCFNYPMIGLKKSYLNTESQRGFGVFFGCSGVLATFSIRLLQSQTPEAGRRAMRGAYLGATLGMIAFLIGRFIS
jgi:hypothetical protein